jgi:transcription elongation factor GreA
MEGNKPIYLTEEGLQKMKDELHFLRTQERARIAKAIADARAQGDLSENAEYDAAKEEQGHLEARISKMESTISDARLVDDSKIDTSRAYILSIVKVKDMKSGREQTYKLVSKEEADIMQGRISVVSPIGKGLLGLSVGDIADIDVPAGKLKLQVLEISR